jgi:hypothetical protein
MDCQPPLMMPLVHFKHNQLMCSCLNMLLLLLLLLVAASAAMTTGAAVAAVSNTY